MSIKLVKNEILRFLDNPSPEIVCISGKWGVGKTYAWKRYLAQAIESNKIAAEYNSYAYISLFGQNSLQDVRNSIFPSTVPLKQIEAGPSPESFIEKAKVIKSRLRKLLPYVTNFVEDYTHVSGINQIFSLFVKKQIVCIDDIERHGQGLSVKDVLGLASYLKEDRHCKVIIILNDEILEEGDKKDFGEQLEKVVDVHLKFEPTSTEALEVGVNKDSSFAELLSRDCAKLGIVNIRVIRKIERLATILEEKFSGFDRQVFENALQSLVLLGWSEYQPAEAPPFDFIKNSSRYSVLGSRDKEKETEEHARWNDFLDAFGWTHFDKLDLLILQGIKRGYFDDALLLEAAKIDASIKHDRSSQEFGEAWEEYHGSFDDNQSEILDKMYNAFKKNVATITPTNLDGTVRLFKELGDSKRAVEMIQFYVQNRSEDKDFYNLADYAFSEDISDPDVIDAFNRRKDAFVDTRNPSDVLQGIVVNRGWNPDDIELLSKLTPNDFYAIFKNSRGKMLHVVIKGALRFLTMNNIGEKEISISKAAMLALKKIGSESLINAKRVSGYGVKVEKVATTPSVPQLKRP